MSVSNLFFQNFLSEIPIDLQFVNGSAKIFYQIFHIKTCVKYYLYLHLHHDNQDRLCESSSAGRARPCQGRGRGFEPRLSLRGQSTGNGAFFLLLVPSLAHAGVVELVDTQDLKSCEPKRSYGFDSRPRYQDPKLDAPGSFFCRNPPLFRFVQFQLLHFR
jgi:hypothetical protein